MTKNRTRIRQGLTSRLRAMMLDVLGEFPIPHTVHATVISIQAGPPSSVTVQYQGDATTDISGIRYPTWYTPTVGDTVILHAVGTDHYMASIIQP